jgi:dihydroneopterin aldolase
MAELRSLREIDAGLGDVPAVIRVRNLQCTIQGPGDAWARRGKPQPMTVSAEVSLARPFGSSSADDAVAGDTVHYGLLSKAILASLAYERSPGRPCTLYNVLDGIMLDLTGFNLRGNPHTPRGGKPFLDVSGIRNLRITLRLPKASRLGGVVSLTSSASFGSEAGEPSLRARGLALGLQELRLPVLIGVNDNERTGRQVVVANAEVDRLDPVGDYPEDAYCGLEQIIEKAMDVSSYETLEALAADLSVAMTKHLASSGGQPSDAAGCHLTIGLEKPIAVTLADAVCVELRTNTNDMVVPP